MAKKRTVSNLLALAVMSYLTREPAHPYELSRMLRDHGDTRSIKFNHGSLYMVVQQLARAGLIVELETTREGQRPERTVYALTDAGRREVRDWLRELVAYTRSTSTRSSSPRSPDRRALPERGGRAPGRPAGTARDQRAGGPRRDRQRSRRRRAPPFLVEEEYRLALLEAESAFVEGFVGRITDPRTDGRRRRAVPRRVHHGRRVEHGSHAARKDGSDDRTQDRIW